jgi:UDP-N-acetylmuramate--alanine ligase
MHYFFVGIGGISMSALSKLLLAEGHTVCGSDLAENTLIKELRTCGCKVYIGHSSENVMGGADIMIVNGAIADNNPECIYARNHNIPIITRDKLLAQIASKYNTVAAVAGCHGKSTTTAMLGACLTSGGFYPTVHNGVKDNLRIGSKNYFVTEACEFKRGFLSLAPSVAVITNIDADHLDCYKDIRDIKNTFAKFAASADIVVKNAEDPNSYSCFGRIKTVTFGINFGSVHTRNLKKQGGKYSFDIVLAPEIFGKWASDFSIALSVPGLHNAANAAAAIAAALVLGVNMSHIKTALENFPGVSRRFEKLTEINNTPVILDYAHHPKEIQTAVETAESLYKNYLLIFQPHTYTRTIALWEDFVTVLSGMKNLWLYKTYAARELPIKGGRAWDLKKSLGNKVKYFAGTGTLKKYINRTAHNFDAIILCGAGDAVKGEFLMPPQ